MRNNYEIIATGGIRLARVGAGRLLEKIAEVEPRIEEIWEAAVAESGGAIFNGSMLAFDSCEVKPGGGADVFGCFVGYKHFIARMRDPGLGLDVRPVGVSGLVICEDGGREYAAFGVRKENTSIYPGRYELVPAGSIEEEFTGPDGLIDFKSKLMNEFDEEIGEFPQGAIVDVAPYAFIFDSDEKVYDCCCLIRLKCPKEMIEEKIAKSPEYRSPEIVAVEDLRAFINKNAGKMVPTSIALSEIHLSSLGL